MYSNNYITKGNVISYFLQDLPECDECNYEQNMQDAISVFPRLLTGLDVNVKFTRYVVHQLVKSVLSLQLVY